jgi:hypothetical protein
MSEPEVLVESYRVTAWPQDLREGLDSASDASTWSCTVTYRGAGRWGVDNGPFCLNRRGEWDMSVSPSDREDDWLDSHRFTQDEALKAAKTATFAITVNGLTTMEAIAGYRKDDNGQAQ